MDFLFQSTSLTDLSGQGTWQPARPFLPAVQTHSHHFGGFSDLHSSDGSVSFVDRHVRNVGVDPKPSKPHLWSSNFASNFQCSFVGGQFDFSSVGSVFVSVSYLHLPFYLFVSLSFFHSVFLSACLSFILSFCQSLAVPLHCVSPLHWAVSPLSC